MPFILDIYNERGGRDFTVFSENSNSFFSPRGRGNPSPSSVVFGKYDDNLKRFLEAEKNVYGPPTLGADSSFPFNFGFRQPYVFVSPLDSPYRRQIKKFDSRNFPVGSVAQDSERLGKMLISGHGIKFLASQQLLQFQAPFDETNIYNPLSVPLAAAMPASFGLLPRPTRHIQTGNTVLGAFASMFGFGAKSNIPPKSTVGVSALAAAAIKDGAGLIRGKTASGGKAHFDAIWVGGSKPQGILGSFFKKLKNTIAPSLGASQPAGVSIRADEGSYDIFLENILEIAAGTSIFRQGIGNENSNRTFHRYRKGVQNIEDDTYIKARGESGNASNRDDLASDGSETSNIKSRFKSSFVTNPNDAQFTEYRNGNLVNDLSRLVQTLNATAQLSDSETNPGSNPSLGYYATKSSPHNGSDGSGGTGKKIKDESRETKYKFSTKTNLDPINHSSQMTEDEFISKNIYDSGNNDIIPFYFKDIINNSYIVFRATLKGLSQNTTPEWVDVKYMGRADRVYLYSGVTRDLSFSFRTYVNRRTELVTMWARIDSLQGLCYPSKLLPLGGKNGFNVNVPPFTNITIGNLYDRIPVIIKSFSCAIPDESPWEIDSGERVPMMADISITATILESEFPQASTNRFYPTPRGFNRDASEAQTEILRNIS